MQKGSGQMKIRGGYSNSAFIARLFAMLLMCVTLLCGALFISLFSALNLEATASTGNTVNIGELTLDGNGNPNSKGYTFNGYNLSKVYSYITGNKNATYNDVANMVTGNVPYGNSSTIAQVIDSQDFRDKNDGNNLIVTFGGKTWTATSLTRDNNGNTILTLWSNYTEQAESTKSRNGDAAATYYGNSYSASYIRAYTLNGGRPIDSTGAIPNSCGHTTNGSNLVVEPQRESSGFARFTMAQISGTRNYLVDYLVRPIDVKYQEIQSRINHISSSRTIYTYHPEAWGTPDPVKIYTNISIIGKPRADDWKYDTIWIPSQTELGNGYVDYAGAAVTVNKGIWNTNREQKAYAPTSWVRTANPWGQGASKNIDSPCANCFSVVNDSEAGFSVVGWGGLAAVRPCVHLNLTDAERDAYYEVNPQEVETEYNGQEQKIEELDFFAEWYREEAMTLTYAASSIIDVGSYSVTVNLTTDITLTEKYEFAGEDSTVRS